ncbi:2'-5' RNA ligase family protein [Roseomonas sp. BN140053]|uniref:2'-5' RNA ligase family protein n=1 Tax=Roseomonas sp. BN140053 TaxID=3391898 RepID=UPI0039E777F8
MPVAVTAVFDPVATAGLARLIGRLSAAGLSRSQESLGYLPHLTLAVQNTEDTGLAGAAARDVLAQLPARLELSGLAVFPGTPSVLYAAAVPTMSWLEMHAALCGRLDRVEEHFRQGNWVPHITLAADLEPGRLCEAMGLLLAGWSTSTLQVRALEVVRFPPVRCELHLPRT